MQARGYIGRYCTYTGEGFQEGVSLTAADEVIRLRKYAYGSCEIMLNKFTVRALDESTSRALLVDIVEEAHQPVAACVCFRVSVGSAR